MYGVLDPDLTPAGTVDSDSESWSERVKAHIKNMNFRFLRSWMFSLKGRGLGNILPYLFFKTFFQLVNVKQKLPESSSVIPGNSQHRVWILFEVGFWHQHLLMGLRLALHEPHCSKCFSKFANDIFVSLESLWIFLYYFAAQGYGPALTVATVRVSAKIFSHLLWKGKTVKTVGKDHKVTGASSYLVVKMRGGWDMPNG